MKLRLKKKSNLNFLISDLNDMKMSFPGDGYHLFIFKRFIGLFILFLAMLTLLLPAGFL